MKSSMLKILLVEDNKGDIRLVKEMLSEVEHFNFELRDVSSSFEAIAEVPEFNPDIVLHDLTLPDSHGLDTVRKFVTVFPRLPLVILTGVNDEKIGIDSVKEGAQDFVVKGEVDGKMLHRIILHSIERKNTSEIIKESEERYRLLFNSSNDAIMVHYIEKDGTVSEFIQVNDLACERLGYTREELLKMTPFNIDSPELKPKIEKVIKKLIAENSIIFESIHVCKSGKTIPVEINSQIFELNGRTACLSVVRDITERKLAEEKINKMNEELQELVNTKDRFFSIIAHDLKSPMNALLGISRFLKDEFDKMSPEDSMDLIKSIGEIGHDTYELLENLLNWATLQRGKMDFHPVRFSLNNKIDNTVKLLSQIASQKSIDIIQNLQNDINIYADENMIELIIRNLISNAIKYSFPAGKIFVSAGKTKDTVEFTIEDFGTGMEQSLIDDLFRIDRQSSRLGTNKERGTGLGLFLCKDMVELHNGKIEIESKIGAGSKFKVVIPNSQLV